MWECQLPKWKTTGRLLPVLTSKKQRKTLCQTGLDSLPLPSEPSPNRPSKPPLTVESYVGPTEKSLKALSWSRSSRNGARRTLNLWQRPTLSRRRARKRRSRSTSATSCKNRAMLSTRLCHPDPATTRQRRTTRSLGDPTSTADAPSATPATACTAFTSATSGISTRSARLSNCCRKRHSTWSSAARSNSGRGAATGHACR